MLLTRACAIPTAPSRGPARSIATLAHTAAFYLPCATIIFEWFHQYRGLATATVFAGAGVGGTVYPFVVNALLGRFGYRTTMLSLALSYAALNLVAVVFIKRRIPLPPREAGVRRHARRKMDFRWMKARAPAVAFTFMMITSLSSFIPMLWLPCKLCGAEFYPG